LDPNGKCTVSVDHKALTAQKSGEIPKTQLASMQNAESLRSAVDSAMRSYCKEFLPEAVVTTYGTVNMGTKVSCCVAARKADLGNYSAGCWRSAWCLEVPSGGSMGALTGKVTCNVHYFEDGNVQLEDNAVFQSEIPVTGSDVGQAFVESVRGFESGFMAKLEEIFAEMSDTVLRSLRRRLPVYGTKFDWDKLAVGKLAGELSGLNTQ